MLLNLMQLYLTSCTLFFSNKESFNFCKIILEGLPTFSNKFTNSLLALNIWQHYVSYSAAQVYFTSAKYFVNFASQNL